MKEEPNSNPEEPIREHVFDGIQEYDKRLPNWWLMTLYGAIVFAAAYWFYYHYPAMHETSGEHLERTMNAIALEAARSSGADFSDEQLWAMSKDSKVSGAGAMIFQTTCASCHMPDLTGKTGVNLKDKIWAHGGKPTEIVATIASGIPVNGIRTCAPVLGKAKIAEVTAYILSYHSPTDPIIPAPTPSAGTTAKP